MSAPVPYWRLSNFYLLYFGTLGALLPYWAVLLKDRGFAANEIGELMALLVGTKIIAPNIWGWVADHTGWHMRLVRHGSLAAMLSFAAVFFVDGYWSMAAVMVVFSFFWNAVLPQFEAVTLNHLGSETHRYARIRLWGSVGFILTVVVAGALLDLWGAGTLPWVLLFLFAGIWLSSLPVSEVGDGPVAPVSGSILGVLRRPEVIALLVVVFLLQASHSPYYIFYTLYLEAHGYSHSVIGPLWALGVVAEIGLFLVMGPLMARLGARGLMVVALALTALRWLMIGAWPDSLLNLVIAQLLHAASFGVVHAVAIHLTHRFFRGRHQSRGQALYSSVSFGAGGAVGNLVSGYLWDSEGPFTVYAIAAGVATLAMLVAVISLHDRDPVPRPSE
ncbi:MAG: MFS transporter [Gammaproteobacteria bacterium]